MVGLPLTRGTEFAVGVRWRRRTRRVAFKRDNAGDPAASVADDEGGAAVGGGVGGLGHLVARSQRSEIQRGAKGAALRPQREMRERSRTWVDIGRVAFRSSGMLLEECGAAHGRSGPRTQLEHARSRREGSVQPGCDPRKAAVAVRDGSVAREPLIGVDN